MLSPTLPIPCPPDTSEQDPTDAPTAGMVATVEPDDDALAAHIDGLLARVILNDDEDAARQLDAMRLPWEAARSGFKRLRVGKVR